MSAVRFARVRGVGITPEIVLSYLPLNYHVVKGEADADSVLITGQDDAGWGLDSYVLPRLASALFFGHEVSNGE
jgi:hypothetical protein